MLRITDRLKVEHGVFLEQLRYIESLVESQASSDVLVAVIEGLGRVLDHHDQIEDKRLYPALAKALGQPHEALEKVDAEHVELRAQGARLRAGAVDAEAVKAWAQALRNHLESEIHMVFPLAEQYLSGPTLASLANWDEEHVYMSAGKREAWQRKLDEGR
jgi:hemerythrin-like domain-containing protein